MECPPCAVLVTYSGVKLDRCDDSGRDFFQLHLADGTALKET